VGCNAFCGCRRLDFLERGYILNNLEQDLIPSMLNETCHMNFECDRNPLNLKCYPVFLEQTCGTLMYTRNQITCSSKEVSCLNELALKIGWPLHKKLVPLKRLRQMKTGFFVIY
jgi:hypothetical protein